jgi:prefoldin subunit 5
MNSINEWYNVIGNIGFPIAVAIYLLIRFEKRIDALRENINQLEQTIRELRRSCSK